MHEACSADLVFDSSSMHARRPLWVVRSFSAIATEPFRQTRHWALVDYLEDDDIDEELEGLY